MLKHSLLAFSIASASFAQPAYNPYISASGGFNTIPDADVDIMGATFLETSYDLGYNVEIATGFDINTQSRETVDFRAELAVARILADGDSQRDPSGLLTGIPGNEGSLDDNVNILTVMVNGYVDMPTGTPFTPYLTAGVGISDIKWDIFSDTVLAVQVGGGVEYALSDNLSLDIRYKYLLNEDVEGNTEFGDAKMNVDAHLFQSGLRITF